MWLMPSDPGDRGPGFLGLLLAFLFMAFVVQLSALAQAEGHLDPGALEMQVQGNEGEALLLKGGAEFVDLAAMAQ